MIRLYELTGAEDDRRFSPYCWRTLMALNHKGLDVERIPWRFTEKGAIAASGQGKVPVILDGERCLHDSWTIAEYLEDSYPDRPSLFGGPVGRGAARFLNAWADQVVNPAIARLIVRDIGEVLAERDRDYFRSSREERFGTTLEQVSADRDQRIGPFRDSLKPLRATLLAQPFLSGAEPAYPDYIVFGSFQWARCTSAYALLEADDPVAGWMGRMLDLFGGLGRSARAA